ncbi:hypothetical protein AYY26_21415 [Photobacterium phosphoreum]|uniref:Uncharacterized protein n=1 Tax=Photobacterium carnosum TaxID=2023717 RepID=A0A2N4UNP1_9GAMM|nr:hypothetical protein CIT27_16995 [Photobacterium carnosum]MCD9465135.1 hypothetical protein [Photobacterium phosphoreum]MCD9472652.1 hypothetical protein [Photobacterium phosphoreum]OBU39569.1 hypothetical protein AYY26_21415 [Photobacterium phosphoreum]PLC56630.1 hypothetical protein CIK00_17575 [Photobacterium carnosum]
MNNKVINIILLSIYLIIFSVFFMLKMYLYSVISLHFILLVIAIMKSSNCKSDKDIYKSKKNIMSHFKLG